MINQYRDIAQDMAEQPFLTNTPKINFSGQLETYTRLGENQYLTGPDFFAKSKDGFTWTVVKQDEYERDLATYETARMSSRPKPKFILTAVRSAFELAAVVGGLASIVAVLIVLTAMV